MENTDHNSSNLSVLVLSSDQEITQNLISNNKSGHTLLARESWSEVSGDSEIMANNAMVILDVDSFDTASKGVKQLIKIKQDDPTQILMVVGEKERLAEFLQSNTQPLIYRAFTKPAHPNQILLAFKHGMQMHKDLVVRRDNNEDLTLVGPEENNATLDTIMESGKFNPLPYVAAAGLVLAAIGGWFAFGGADEQEQVQSIVSAPEVILEDAAQENLTPDVSQINNLNQLAASAVYNGQLISPAGQNALEFYNQVLEIDSYDNTAYEGRLEVASLLRASYPDLIKSGKFDEAIETLDVLRELQPLNAENETMALALETQIEQHVNTVRESGSQAQIAETTAVLASITPKVNASKNLSEALEKEKLLLNKIDSAIAADAVLPTQDDNAYDLLSGAIKKNSISKANIQPRVVSLSEKIMQMASVSFKADELEETAKLLDLVKPLNVNKDQVKAAQSQLKERQNQIALASQEAAEKLLAEQQKEVVKEEIAKIRPAKLIKRPPPNYPVGAKRKNIEGWVEMAFSIDAKGKPYDITVVESEPAEVFNKEAMKSVKKWRFDPAFNETTNEAAESYVESVKLTFQLQ